MEVKWTLCGLRQRGFFYCSFVYGCYIHMLVQCVPLNPIHELSFEHLSDSTFLSNVQQFEHSDRGENSPMMVE